MVCRGVHRERVVDNLLSNAIKYSPAHSPIRVTLILLDITMPRMDGYTFAEELQRLGLHERVALLVFTADGRARQKAERVGAAGYLHKPFEIDQLLRTVARIVAPVDGSAER